MRQYIQIAILMNKTKYSFKEVYDYLNGSDTLTEKQVQKLDAAKEKMETAKHASLAREYKMMQNAVKAMEENDYGKDQPAEYADAKSYLKDLEDSILSECTHIANAKELQGITWKEVLDGSKKDVVINYYLKKHNVKVD